MDRDSAEFVIYIINEVANRYGKYPSFIYSKLKEAGCIDSFLVPCYDVLHTMGSHTVVDDVVEYLKVRGIDL